MKKKDQTKALENWINEIDPKLGKLKNIKKFEIGQSNPTYKLEFESKILVLRSKPFGQLLRGAHRIDREFKVMSAIYNTKIPVPQMIGYCEYQNIFGTEFYIMEFIDGIQEKNPILPNFNTDEKQIIYNDKLKILINLSKLNLKKIKLDNYSRSINYLERQITLWINQYRSSETKKISSMEYLIDKLLKHVPKIFEKLPAILIHGDFRQDNMIIEKNKIAALLDWELSTLAPPFIDLSYWCVMLRFKKNWPISGLGFNESRNNFDGIPSEKELLETYSNELGYDILKHWNYLLAFNCFRFAGILQGITKRVLDGNNAGSRGKMIGGQALPVAKMGEMFLKQYI